MNLNPVSIFISYKENDFESETIVKSISNFFNAWEKISCEPIKYQETSDPPEDIITDGLTMANYLIQVLNLPDGPSTWMEKEWDYANAYSDHKNIDMKKPIALYTNKVDLTRNEYKYLKLAKIKGSHRVININQQSVSETLLGILKETHRLPSKHGEIITPDFQTHTSKSNKGTDINALLEFINNYKDANEKGLQSIYPDNKKAKINIIAQLNQLKKGESIQMIGFTLHRYTHPEDADGTGNLLSLKIKELDIKLQMLLLDPYCYSAKARMRIESHIDPENESEMKKAILYINNRAVAKYFETDSMKKNVEIKYYRTPYAGMILFERSIFVELYHLGDDGLEEGGKGEPNPNATICGRVPVLEVKSPSPFYKLFRSHFERIWDDAESAPRSC